MKLHPWIFSLLFAFLFCPSILWSGPRFVIDDAQLMPKEERLTLNNRLSQIYQQGGPQIFVVTLQSLDHYSIEERARIIFDARKIGHKDKDDGVLLLIGFQERKIRIETGYGAQRVLTDNKAYEIIHEIIAPAFKRGDYSKGIHKGVEAILKPFKHSLHPPPKDLLLFNLVMGIFALISIPIANTFMEDFLPPFVWLAMGSGLSGMANSNYAGHLAFFLCGVILISAGVLFKNLFFPKPKKNWNAMECNYEGGNSESDADCGGGGSGGGGGASGGW